MTMRLRAAAVFLAVAAIATPGAAAKADGGAPAPAASAPPAAPRSQAALRACLGRIGRGVQVPSDSSLERTLLGLCSFSPSPELERCTHSYLRKVPYFQTYPERAYALCEESTGEKRRCFDDLARRNVLRGSEDRFYVCDRAEGEQRQCLLDAMGRKPGFYFNDLVSACEIPAGSGRQCVLDRMLGPGSADIEDAKDSCKYYNAETRSCVEDYQRRRGLFAWPVPAEGARLPEHPVPLASPSPGQRILADSADRHMAEEICVVSHVEDRECVVRTYLNRLLPESSPEHPPDRLRDLNVKLCVMATHERESCLKVLRDYGIRADDQDSYAICNIPNFETRACVVSKLIGRRGGHSILDIFSGPPTALSYLYSCASEMAGALTGRRLDDFVARLSCAFSR